MNVLMYGSERKIWKEKERSRIRVAQKGMKRIDKVLNVRIRELCGATKGLMKAFSDGSAIWREWRMTGLL